jgi:hypothetical protein
MNWLNIYGDNKSVAVALSQMDEGDIVKANLEDAPNIRVSISNQYHRTGTAKFVTKQMMDEEGEHVLTITRDGGKPTAKQHRNLAVTTFRDGNVCGTLRVKDYTAYLSISYMDSNEAVLEYPTKIIDKANEFIKKHNINKLNY